MIPRRVRYECPKCKRKESHTEGDCGPFLRSCPKCKVRLVAKDSSVGGYPNPTELLDKILNLFK